jgi:hypothetical protein
MRFGHVKQNDEGQEFTAAMLPAPYDRGMSFFVN